MVTISRDVEDILETCQQVSAEGFNEYTWGESNTYVINAQGELTHLSIENCEDINFVNITHLQQLQVLILRQCNIQQLPDKISQLQSLKVLNLNDNQLSILPESIGQLQSLVQLHLENNQLTLLPESIVQLQYLEQLYLDNNQLSLLPESFVQLQSLQVLHLNDNQLSLLPESIGQLQNLEELHLDNNLFTLFPESIGQLQKLERLDLNVNQLSILPESIRQLQNLEELHIDNNQLTLLPESIGQLQKLERLYLNDNQLSLLPESIGQLKKLERLGLNDNQLSVLPESIGQLKKLESLDLSDNQLSILPESIGQLQNLLLLHLDNNQLTLFPESIGQLQKLERLDLDNNQLSILPESIGQLQNLNVLYLNGNQLSLLPESIGQLQKLEQLQLDSNQLSLLPESIGQLQKLGKINLDNNQLSVLPESIGQLKSIESLDLDNNQLSVFPESIVQLESLQVLYLNNNKFSSLPESISQLQHLKQLHLNNNQLSLLPESIVQLQYLEQLYLNNNQLSLFPGSIVQLQRLQVLHLNNNQLSVLPESIGQLESLEELYLDNNQLLLFPESISQLQNLVLLYLDNNQLSILPESIGQLQNLVLLYLSANKLSLLPESIGRLQKLEVLHLENNPLPINTAELEGLSVKDKIRTILKIQQGNTTPLNEAKILVVGDERVGKTSIINRLAGYLHDNNQASTEGINISNQKLRNDIRVNIWDFAGQEITHQTHQFFLSTRSLYLYVIDSQREDNDSATYHWLSIIKAYGGGKSPIIIVVNKCDLSRSYHFDIERYKNEFNIVDVVYTTAENSKKIKGEVWAEIKHDIDELKIRVEKHVSELEGVNFPFPDNWLKVKQRLEECKEGNTDYIESVEYEKQCEEQAVTEQKDQQTLLNLLNQIGTIVTYQQDSRLNSMQIIKPQWVTHAVYKIIRSPLVKNNGILTEDRIADILLSDREYKPRHYRWLMNLLIQFELAFEIDKTTLLLPSNLSSTQPEIAFTDYLKGLKFRFSYQDILKKNVISQLIVRLHHRIDQGSDKYWQRGVFLKHGDSKAVIISDENKKIIDILINKNSRNARELLTLIRDGINAINGKSLEANEEVPLVLDGKIVGYGDYNFITDAEKQGLKDLPLAISVQNDRRKKSHVFKVRDLLDGYRPEEKSEFNYPELTKDLLNIAAIETENRHAIFNENENQTNSRVRNALLYKNYYVSDQSLGGESSTGKQSGERDIVVRNQYGETESIIEALIIKGWNSKSVKDHYSKLIMRYDTIGNKRNFILVYAKTDEFEKRWKQYCDFYDREFGGFNDNSEQEISKSNIKTGISTFKGRQVYHIFVDLFSEQPL